MDKITQGLQRYQSANGDKYGILFTKTQVFYLFQRQFCTIKSQQTYLDSITLKMDIRASTHSLLIWSNGTECHIYTPEEEISGEYHFWSLLHLDCQDSGGRDLCALLHIEHGIAHHLRFVDGEIEKLFLHLLQKNQQIQFPKVPIANDFPHQLHQEGMERLTALYLQGKPMQELQKNRQEVSYELSPV